MSSETGELRAALKDVWRALPGAARAVPRAVGRGVSAAGRWLWGLGPWWALVICVGGLLFVGLSLLPGPGYDAAWARDALLTLGASLALFGPFWLATRVIEDHVDEVAEGTKQDIAAARTANQKEVAAVREQAAAWNAQQDAKVQGLQEGLNRLEQASAGFSAAVEADAQADRVAFEALQREEPTREIVTNALSRALRLELVEWARPPRVQVCNGNFMYLAVQWRGGDFDELILWLEDLTGTVSGGDVFEWSAGTSWQDAFGPIATALRRQSNETLDLKRFMSGLADMLLAALDHPERRPVIEFAQPQWLVSGGDLPAVVSAPPAPLYAVPAVRLHAEPNMLGHVAGKTWVDEDSWRRACLSAQSLFPEPTQWGSRQ